MVRKKCLGRSWRFGFSDLQGQLGRTGFSYGFLTIVLVSSVASQLSSSSSSRDSIDWVVSKIGPYRGRRNLIRNILLHIGGTCQNRGELFTHEFEKTGVFLTVYFSVIYTGVFFQCK